MLDDIQLCILYLLDFEVAYCAHFSKDGEEKIDTTDLDEARNIIRKRLKKWALFNTIAMLKEK